jgi:hypothetical protein
MVHCVGLQIEQVCFHSDNLARFLSQRMSFTFLAQFLPRIFDCYFLLLFGNLSLLIIVGLCIFTGVFDEVCYGTI